jgi:nucleotide-binding universal stress UspA family protein
MATIQNILFPVDFSPSCIAMAPYVKRSAAMFSAKVTLVHVFDLYSHDAFQLYVRSLSEVAEEQQNLARDKLDSFLKSEFPVGECPRILLSGVAATQITQLARTNGFDLIIMPTHADLFRRMLLGSTTSKVLNDADCPVLTAQHVQTIGGTMAGTIIAPAGVTFSTAGNATRTTPDCTAWGAQGVGDHGEHDKYASSISEEVI